MCECKNAIERKIEQCMKDYNLTEEDLKIGNAFQIKGYVMGLKEALRILSQNQENEESSNKTSDEKNNNDTEYRNEYRRSSSSRRRRTNTQED